MTPTEAMRLTGLIWHGKKLRNLACPRMGHVDTWADVILTAEEAIAAVVDLSINSPLNGPRCQIVRRRMIDQAIRGVTTNPSFYSRPLYVSEGHLLRIAAAEAAMPAPAPGRRPRRPKEPACREEHVIPLAVHASGKEIIADPERNLRRLRRTFLGPICIVTPQEDDDIRLSKGRVKGHERPDRPFQRYDGIATVRLTRTGAIVDPKTWTFRSHLAEMSVNPAYATAVPLFAHGSKVWLERIARIRS
jgi:hypothetical protein